MAQEQKLMELLLSGPVRGLKEASSGENIPYRKRAGAASDITGGRVPPEKILVVQDQTLFGSATDGMVFTLESMYIKPAFDDIFMCHYTDIANVRLITKSMRFLDQVEIKLNSSRTYLIKGNNYIEPEAFIIWLKEVVAEARALAGMSPLDGFSQDYANSSMYSSSSDISNASSSYASESSAKIKIELNPKTDIASLERQALALGINIPKPEPVQMLLHNDLMKLLTERAYILSKDSYYLPNIPARKLGGAVDSIAKNLVKPEDVVLIFDDTLFGSATDGMLFTRTMMFFKDVAEDPTAIKLVDIKRVIPYAKLGIFKTIQMDLVDGRSIILPKFQCIDDMDNFHVWFSAVVDLAKYEFALVKALEERSSAPAALANPYQGDASFYDEPSDPRHRKFIDVEAEDIDSSSNHDDKNISSSHSPD